MINIIISFSLAKDTKDDTVLYPMSEKGNNNNARVDFFNKYEKILQM